MHIFVSLIIHKIPGLVNRKEFFFLFRQTRVFQKSLPVYGGNITDFSLHVFTDMRRSQTFTFIPKAEENIIMVVVFHERKINNIMRITVPSFI